MSAGTSPPFCSFNSRHDVFRLLGLPPQELNSTVAQCPDICRLLYGPGNTDLAGVGVAISYVIGFSLAILHASILSLRYVPPPFRRHPILPAFTSCLEKYQETGVWSQLLFSLSFAVACCVRAFQSDVPTYDSSMTKLVLLVNLASMLLTVASFYKEIKPSVVFFPALLATLVCAFFAGFALVIKGHCEDPILQACVHTVLRQFAPWASSGPEPFDFPQDLRFYITYPVIYFFFTALWYILWLYRERWVDIYKNCLSKGLAWIARVLLVFILLGSLGLAVIGGGAIYSLYRMRYALGLGWAGDIEENRWGVGHCSRILESGDFGQ